MDRKKQTSSGLAPDKSRHHDHGASASVDEAWDKLSDADLVELGESGEEPISLEDAQVVSGESSRATIQDLPAPVGPTPTRGPGRGRATVTDLLAPVGPVPRKSIPDLLAPVGPRSSRNYATPTGAPVAEESHAAARPTAMPDDTDLLAPVGPIPTKQLPDLLTPVGPNPTKGSVDLPAPKGFFDDGVQPKHGPGSELPAPKGFFDDGVQPRLGSRGSSGQDPLDLDFGLELNDNPSQAHALLDPEETGDPGPLSLDLGDLPNAGTGAVNRPFGLDAADLELERMGDVTPPPLSLELNDVPSSPGTAMPRSRTSRLEISQNTPPPLPPPPSPGLSFAAAAPRKRSDSENPFAPTRAAGHMLTTEIRLEVDALQGPGVAPLPVSVTAKRAPARTAEIDRRKRPPTEERRRLTLVLAGALGATILGAGAYLGHGWWQGRQERDARQASGLRQVEKLLGEDSPTHWEQAASAAKRARSTDAQGLEATAVVAEASFAAALDESPQASERIKEGDLALRDVRARPSRGPHAIKAEALRAILGTNFDQAVRLLEQLRATAPTDREATLYLAWAYAAKEQHAKAVTAYTAALGKGQPRIPALYGLALSQLELGDKDAALKSFQAVIEESRDRFKRDHLGALIGLAQLAPVSERESRYQELMARPDLTASPPRAVSRLRTLAGDEALRAGRLDQARTRYDQAHALDPLNLRASVGLALLAARAGDFAIARKRLIGDVLETAPEHIEAALALIDVALAEKKRDEAGALVEAMFARKPPIANATLLGRTYLARARVYESSSDPTVQAKAEAEYREAMTRADPGDYAATVGLSSLLVRLNRKSEALQVLGPVKAAAKEDPGLALTLGSAYLSADQPEAAAEAFRSVLQRRPDDAEARFQLGRAYLASGKFNDATDAMQRAYEIDPSREDIGLGLARTLEAGGRSRDAVVAYMKMLGGERKASVTVRAQAGRAFARLGLFAEAAAQGEAILKEEPSNSAGMFLHGEKLYSEGKWEEALKAYQQAARIQTDAQYSEAQGRASEKLGQTDEALRYYGDAAAAEPRYLAPRLGRGRVRLGRREYVLAVSELTAALKVAPDNAEVMRDLGRAYLAVRDIQRGIAFLERSVAINGRDPNALYALGCVYHDLDKPRQAAPLLGRAVQLAKPDTAWRAEAYRMLGYSQRAAGNRGAAISAWRTFLQVERADSPERRDVERMLMRLEAGGK